MVIIAFLLLLGSVLLGEYFMLTPLAGFWSTYFYFGFFLVLFICLAVLALKKKQRKPAKVKWIFGIGTTVYVGSALLILVFTYPMFTAGRYKNLLPAPVEKEFSKEISAFDVSKAPIVTKSTAMQIADKAISQDGTIGSSAEMKDITLQSVKGSLYWVTPLEYSGFFAWSSNKSEGTPFIMVNANTKECKLIKAHIRYQPSAYFGQDLARKLFNTNRGYGYTDFTFEVDDNEHPYWTASVYKNTIGFNGAKVTGTAVVDAETGEVKIYSVEDTPKWVDRIQPAEFVDSNINDRGRYINGFHPFNNNGKFKTTDNTGIVYNNGKCYYYTGITSVGKDQSSLGFYLVDTRTEETTYFKLNGAATETAAINSAQGKLQQLGYTGTSPILMNVENKATYFIPMQDKYGLTKQYAMVSVEDHTVLGTGESIEECKEAYIKALFEKNQLQVTAGSKQEITGTVKRIGQFVQQGNSYFTIQLDNNYMIFIVPVNQSPKLPITKEGDMVTIQYIKSTLDNSITSIAFENNTVK